jgi:hypothetical protein
MQVRLVHGAYMLDYLGCLQTVGTVKNRREDQATRLYQYTRISCTLPLARPLRDHIDRHRFVYVRAASNFLVVAAV